MSEIISDPTVETAETAQPFNLSDPQAMRALAHETRLDALEELYSTTAARTATQLAAYCGVTAPAMSYHLRILEKYGFIERAEESADGRERLWRPVGTELVLGTDTAYGQTQKSKFAIVDQQMSRQRRRITEELVRRDAAKPEVAPATPVLSTGTVALSEDDRDEFMTRMNDLLDEFEVRSREAVDTAQRVYYLVSLVAESPQLGA